MALKFSHGLAAILGTIMLSAAAFAGTAHPNLHEQEVTGDNPSYQEIVVRERAERWRQEHQPSQPPATAKAPQAAPGTPGTSTAGH